MSTQNTLTPTLGGWTAYQEPTAQELAIFNEAMKGIIGVNYKPQTVSSQVVAGMNYRFKCHASLPQAPIGGWEAVVEIYQPLEGLPPYVTGIIRL